MGHFMLEKTEETKEFYIQRLQIHVQPWSDKCFTPIHQQNLPSLLLDFSCKVFEKTFLS